MRLLRNYALSYPIIPIQLTCWWNNSYRTFISHQITNITAAKQSPSWTTTGFLSISTKSVSILSYCNQDREVKCKQVSTTAMPLTFISHYRYKNKRHWNFLRKNICGSKRKEEWRVKFYVVNAGRKFLFIHARILTPKQLMIRGSWTRHICSYETTTIDVYNKYRATNYLRFLGLSENAWRTCTEFCQSDYHYCIHDRARHNGKHGGKEA